jgi:hypothetical protein
MWKRTPKDRRPAPEHVPALGVGVQVYVREHVPPADDDWVDEPTGVIVSPGDRNLRNIYGPLDGFTTWTVSFYEPQHRRDGRGPYQTAVIPAALLVAAEPVDD